jgi:ankyrin repeat protein
MKSIKNISLLTVAGLLSQVSIGFVYGADRWAERGQRIADAVNFFGSRSDSKLIEAAKEGNLKDLQAALNDSNIDEIGEKSGITALMHASRNGCKNMVVLLLNKGASPHIRGAWGDNTALREAVKAGHKEIVELLLAKCVDKRDASARLSMGYALIEAAKKGDKDMIKLLLDKDADPNIEGTSDSDNVLTSTTALSEAAGRGHEDIVKLLLDNGADVHIRNVWGTTALETAKLRGHKKIVQLIESARQ